MQVTLRRGLVLTFFYPYVENLRFPVAKGKAEVFIEAFKSNIKKVI